MQRVDVLKKFIVNEDETPKYRVFWIIALIMIGLWLGQFLAIKYYFIPNGNDPEKQLEIWTHRGVIGDSFGAINALFSGLAFAGVVFAILLQRGDIKRQHSESKGQAESFAKEIHEIQQQTKELTRQIKLSIMPSFIVEVLEEEIFDELRKNLIATEYTAKITNVGNGMGINIVFNNVVNDFLVEALPLTEQTLTIKQIAFLKPHTSTNINFTGNGIDITKKLVPLNEASIIEYLYHKHTENNPYVINLSFQDIEGTKYKQEIKISSSISIPGKVEEDK